MAEITGTSGDDVLNGSADSDILRGLEGNDTLNAFGGNDFLVGGSGNDTMSGGTGDDTYYVDAGGDIVIDVDGEGNDRIATTTSYVLAAAAAIERLEALDLSSSTFLDFSGNGFSNTLIGNAGVNILRGGGGSDSLAGLEGDDFLEGGAGADVMEGGAGNDVYFVDDVGDLVIESVAGGFDRLTASISYVLTAGSPIERLDAVTLSATDALDFTGNDAVQTIGGNNGANILRGLGGDDRLEGYGGNDALDGGTGADVMEGGLGNDTYYVDNSLDVVIEVDGQGTDRIASNVDYTLAAGVAVENLEATNSGSTSALNLTGNDFANTIIGNSGLNVLIGNGGNDTIIALGGDDRIAGGFGNDFVDGGTGTDRYVLEDAASGYKVTTTQTSIIIEDINLANGDEGTDTLVNVEQIQFGGEIQSVQFEIDQAAMASIVLSAPDYFNMA